jgi:hypothetical protein
MKKLKIPKELISLIKKVTLTDIQNKISADGEYHKVLEEKSKSDKGIRKFFARSVNFTYLQ